MFIKRASKLASEQAGKPTSRQAPALSGQAGRLVVYAATVALCSFSSNALIIFWIASTSFSSKYFSPH